MWHGRFGRFGDSSPQLLRRFLLVCVSGFPLFLFENLRLGIEVIGQKLARWLAQLLGVFPREIYTPLHLFCG